jgi:FMN phosphatase YigB (HAD superfamily)
MNIGLDLDGVLYPFTEVIHAFAEKHLGIPLPRNFEKWGFFDDWGMDWPEFLTLMEEGHAAGMVYHEGLITEGAVDVINRLSEHGHEITFITARGTYARATTRAWLDSHGLYHELIMGAEDKGSHPLDVLLDDGAHNIEAARAAGIRAIVFDQPWNQEVPGERVWTWAEFGSRMLHPSAGPEVLQLQQQESRR